MIGYENNYLEINETMKNIHGNLFIHILEFNQRNVRKGREHHFYARKESFLANNAL